MPLKLFKYLLIKSKSIGLLFIYQEAYLLKASGVTSKNASSQVMPALLTKPSTGPNFSKALFAAPQSAKSTQTVSMDGVSFLRTSNSL